MMHAFSLIACPWHRLPRQHDRAACTHAALFHACEFHSPDGHVMCSRMSEAEQRIALGHMMLQSLYDERERNVRLGLDTSQPLGPDRQSPANDRSDEAGPTSAPEPATSHADSPGHLLGSWHEGSMAPQYHTRPAARSAAGFHPPFHWTDRGRLDQQISGSQAWQVKHAACWFKYLT